VGDLTGYGNGNDASKSAGKQRNVSEIIEKRASQFEKCPESEQMGKVLDRQRSSERLRVGTIRRKASEEHNRLRQLFEEGEGFRRGSGPIAAH